MLLIGFSEILMVKAVFICPDPSVMTDSRFSIWFITELRIYPVATRISKLGGERMRLSLCTKGILHRGQSSFGGLASCVISQSLTRLFASLINSRNSSVEILLLELINP